MTILGHSGCGGWALVISNTDEVLFIKRCDKSIFFTGNIFNMNLNKIRILYAYKNSLTLDFIL